MNNFCPSVCIMTVQHTGTHFVAWLLRKLNLVPRNPGPGQKHFFHAHSHSDIPGEYVHLMQCTPTIVTRRDPILSFISHMDRKTDNVEIIKSQWNCFLSIIPTLPRLFVFDIHCPAEQREQHLYDCVSFFDEKLAQNSSQVIKHYADKWQPINVFGQSKIKQKYLETGFIEKPEVYEHLGPAIEWFNSTNTGRILSNARQRG